jgi:small conductance mechanosensitive channel
VGSFLAIGPLTGISTWLRGAGLEIALLVLGGVLLTRFVKWTGDRITRRIDAAAAHDDSLVRSEAAKHRHAIVQVLVWVAIAILWCVDVVLVLDRFGVPVASLAAPGAVLAAAIGFGAQQVVRDYIAGAFIIAERQYGFGDVVRISALGFADGAIGTIEEVALRITRLRTPNGEVVVVPNGRFVQVTNLSRDWARAVVDVPLPTAEDVLEASKLLRQVGTEAFADESLRPLLLDAPSVLGVESFEVDQINLRMVARTLPGKQFEVGRELRVRVAVAFQRAGIGSPPELETGPPAAAG